MIKTLIGINTLTAVNQVSYANHMQFFYRLGKEWSGHQFILNAPQRASIDRMRNESARIALEQECDYLMFIDDDVIVPLNAYGRLLEADKDIVAGNVVIRGYPFNNMFFRWSGDRKNLDFYNEIRESEPLVRVDAVGFSCVLIKCKLLKQIAPPYFVTGTSNTEDIYFCLKAKTFDPDVTIYVDQTLKCGHVLTPQMVTPDNRELWKGMEETENPALLEASFRDRGDHYLKVNGVEP